MTGIFSLITLIACQQGFDKDGSEVNQTNEYGETVDQDGNSLSTPNHDWDDDGYTENDGDCDDDNPDVNPGEEEIYYDDIDSNCDGLNDFDADGDGHISSNWGGDDCDDSNADINPSVEDDPTDGLDTDCDGEDDPRFIYYAVDEDMSDSNGAIALDVDSTKKVHLVYEEGGELWYTNKNPVSGSWRTPISTALPIDGEVATGGYGQQLDGVIDSAYRFHIAYSEIDNSGNLSTHYAYLKNIRTTVSEWIGDYEIEGMNSSGNNLSSHYLNIDVGSDNIPVFAYYDENANRPVLSKLAGIPSSGQNSIGFQYRDEADFLFDFVPVSDAPMGTNTALAIGPTDLAYILFLDETAPSGTGDDPETQLSMRNNLTFQCESSPTVGTGGLAHAIALRPDNKLCMAYHDMNDNGLKYACQVNASNCEDWDIQTIETGLGSESTLALGFTSGSIPYVAYHHTPTGTVRVASLQGTEWDIVTAGAENGSDVGANIQMAIDSDDRVHLAFYNSSTGGIWYAMGR